MTIAGFIRYKIKYKMDKACSKTNQSSAAAERQVPIENGEEEYKEINMSVDNSTITHRILSRV